MHKQLQAMESPVGPGNKASYTVDIPCLSQCQGCGHAITMFDHVGSNPGTVSPGSQSTQMVQGASKRLLKATRLQLQGICVVAFSRHTTTQDICKWQQYMGRKSTQAVQHLQNVPHLCSIHELLEVVSTPVHRVAGGERGDSLVTLV